MAGLLQAYYSIMQFFKKFVARENEILKMMVMTKPELYLDEYKDWFKEITGKQISISTMCRSIIRLGFTYKKVITYKKVKIYYVSDNLNGIFSKVYPLLCFFLVNSYC